MFAHVLFALCLVDLLILCEHLVKVNASRLFRFLEAVILLDPYVAKGDHAYVCLGWPLIVTQQVIDRCFYFLSLAWELSQSCSLTHRPGSLSEVATLFFLTEVASQENSRPFGDWGVSRSPTRLTVASCSRCKRFECVFLFPCT